MTDPDLDLSDCVDLLARDTVTRRRYADQSVSGEGLVVPGATTDLLFDAQVTPATGRDLQRLPEGQRTTRAIRVITTVELRTAVTDPGAATSRKRADAILYDDSQFEVQNVQAWTSQGGFYDAVATEVRR